MVTIIHILTWYKGNIRNIGPEDTNGAQDRRICATFLSGLNNHIMSKSQTTTVLLYSSLLMQVFQIATSH